MEEFNNKIVILNDYAKKSFIKKIKFWELFLVQNKKSNQIRFFKL